MNIVITICRHLHFRVYEICDHCRGKVNLNPKKMPSLHLITAEMSEKLFKKL